MKFKNEATFWLNKGLDGKAGTWSFESVNSPDHFVQFHHKQVKLTSYKHLGKKENASFKVFMQD